MEVMGWIFLSVMGLLVSTAVGIAFWETYKIIKFEFKD